MRLANTLERGQTRLQRGLFTVLRRVVGHIPGPIAVVSYRPAFFGQAFSHLLQISMRKSRHWSVGETELFAAFVSKKNACQY